MLRKRHRNCATACQQAALTSTLAEQLFDHEQDTPTHRNVLAASAQRDFSGISNASHTACHTALGSIPSAKAWSTVRPPRLASVAKDYALAIACRATVVFPDPSGP